MQSDLKAFFSNEEVLGRFLPGYQFRSNQLEMAEKVLEAFSNGKVLLVEAPSGTGKSLAYLAAAFVYSSGAGVRVVISTYTKTLQNQLYYKDLPLLEKVTGKKCRYALCIGSGNYVCRRRLDRELKTGLFEKLAAEKEAFLEWLDETPTGLFTDLDIKLPSGVREKINRDRRACNTGSCPNSERCFYVKGRRRIKNADIIVANHSMTFTDIAREVDILPAEYVLVADEAHTVEAVAREKFSDEFSSFALERYIERILTYLDAPVRDGLFSGARDVVLRLRVNMDKLKKQADLLRENMRGINPKGEKVMLEKEKYDLSGLYLCLESNAQMLEELVVECAGNESGDFLPQAFLDWTAELMKLINVIFWEDSETRFYWQETSGHGKRTGYKFHSTLLDVGEDLREHLFSSGLSRVFTSATMTTGGEGEDQFNYIKGALGIEETETIKLPEVFDYSKNVYFCVPRGIADPAHDHETYQRQIVDHICRVYDVLDRGMFVLLTSYRMLEFCDQHLRVSRPGMDILKQGQLPRYVLLDIFKSRKDKTVLLGTASFWQGVDVAGDALQGVVITRLPFSVPTDPVTKMRIDHLNRTGRNAFTEYQLPESLIMFKQGFGRLIRNQNDTGVVVVLDPRVRTRSYGKRFLEVLPNMTVREDLDGVSHFLKSTQRTVL